MTEVFVDKGKKRKYSAIGLTRVENLSERWHYLRLEHDPEKETK